jgi:3-oxoacyl-[acyl-carrier protein] reductase
MRLQDKTAVITGGALGIGRACGERFAREGARLVVADRCVEQGEALVEGIRKNGGQAHFVAADLACRTDSEQAIDACMEAYGRLDILFCNAGINLSKRLPDTTDEDIDRLLNVNVKALMYAARHALPIMQAQANGGSILFTASKTGLVAQTDSPVYCASKGAVVMLAKALALDYAKVGIRVNTICPGIIDTPMLKNLSAAAPDPDATWRAYSEAQPMGRLGTSEECADAALWLVSDEASFITGIALPIDGGFMAG